ncbi:uncharacterized protein C5orf47 homolog [Corvus moneduloides]|uniref:uncharacterized protein C5orf47 homolog n=1 Tax=Corvus moneduloides TaxID=1196302 RepID=UPI00136363CB|nr:uncharacterized protein C5orf47 homolog [Corvus moneduloides]
MPAAPPQMERGRRALPPVPLVYVNTFGSHRCGSVIRLGRGCRQSPGQSPPGRAGAPRAVPEPRAGPSREPGGGGRRAGSGGEGRPGSRAPGGPQEAKTDTFDFPIPSRNVDKVIKRKKKKSKVWHKVWRVISKMLEENERFRSRLLSCSQFNEAGSDRIQRSQNGAYLDRDEFIFGWV